MMGCGGSNEMATTNNSREGKKSIKADWEMMRQKLPRTRSAEDNKKRDDLFKLFDPNGNGHLSLAEVDKGAREILQLHKITDKLSPILIRAFTAAKDVRKRHGHTNDNTDYVQCPEFRLLLVYIYDYFEMWVAFDEIDTSDDRRVSLKEFKAAVPMIESWGIKISNPEATFKSIDNNGGGMILFSEFCDWAIAQHLDVDDNENQK
eukprot:Tbor_TRINITY_DN3989_c0_g1::TRINITY_DN3989_c0_g1_i2::g.798::m.798